MEEVKKRKGRPKKGEGAKNESSCIISDPLIEPYFISRDAYNFEVIKKSLPTRGFAGAEASTKEKHTTVGHYTSFSNALRCISREKFYTNKEDFNSIQEYMNSWNELKEGIETLLNKVEI